MGLRLKDDTDPDPDPDEVPARFINFLNDRLCPSQ